MRAKQVYEFHKGSDPLRALNVGIDNQIKNDIKNETSIDPELVDIRGSVITKKKNTYFSSWEWDKVFDVQLRYLTQPEIEFLKAIHTNRDRGPNIVSFIDKAIKDGLSVDRVKQLIAAWGHDRLLDKATPYLSKLARTKEEIEYDEDTNIYVFIGYNEKHPVNVNGKKYYEDRFQAESMIKIDKYNTGDLESVGMLKVRAMHQYGGQAGAGVYMVQVPKKIMDEDRYDSIPEEYRWIIEKYMKKI